jgi:predicted nucleotidyltransferase
VAVLAFGSLAAGELKPLSDLDFGVLVSKQIDKEKRFDKHLELIGLFTEIFQTEEVDLVMFNDAPMRFSHKIIASGKLLYCADRPELTDFIEKTVKRHLDFKFFRDEFDSVFLAGIGYHDGKVSQPKIYPENDIWIAALANEGYPGHSLQLS